MANHLKRRAVAAVLSYALSAGLGAGQDASTVAISAARDAIATKHTFEFAGNSRENAT